MSSLEELRDVIAQLDPAQRAALLVSLCDLEPTEYEVRETALKYGVDPPEELMSVEEYLAFEERSTVRHEYLGGQVFAMSGATLRHNVITQNLLRALGSHLEGGPCRSFVIDARVRFAVNRDECFYYPDLMVACGKVDLDRNFVQEPRLIVEVLSASTEAIDRREKAFHYRQIDSVEEYVLVAQRMREITLFRRDGESWNTCRWTDISASVELKSIDLALPLAKIYQGT